MQNLVKLLMISLFGEIYRKDNIDEYSCKSECRMCTEYDERVIDNWKLRHSEYFVEKK